MSTQPAVTDVTGSTRALDLWHICIDDAKVSLCGQPLAGQPVPYVVAVPGQDCVVCDDLAEQFIAGTWRP